MSKRPKGRVTTEESKGGEVIYTSPNLDSPVTNTGDVNSLCLQLMEKLRIESEALCLRAEVVNQLLPVEPLNAKIYTLLMTAFNFFADGNDETDINAIEVILDDIELLITNHKQQLTFENSFEANRHIYNTHFTS